MGARDSEDILGRGSRAAAPATHADDASMDDEEEEAEDAGTYGIALSELASRVEAAAIAIAPLSSSASPSSASPSAAAAAIAGMPAQGMAGSKRPGIARVSLAAPLARRQRLVRVVALLDRAQPGAGAMCVLAFLR
jgi:hypothetical protein